MAGNERSRRPRVALVSTYPVDHVSVRTGVQAATVALVEGLRAFTDELDVHLVNTTLGPPATEEHEGITFHSIGGRWLPSVRPRYVGRWIALGAFVRELGPDLVHCHGNAGLAVGLRRFRGPLVLTRHGARGAEATHLRGRERLGARLDGLIEGRAITRYDAFVCNSEFIRRITPDRPLNALIPNAVRSRFYDVARGEPKHLLFLGAISPLKRPLDLLAAHAELRRDFPELETVFCGPVEDRGYAAPLVEGRTPGARFVGGAAEGEVAALLRDAIALVLPSAHENVPIVIAEAQAAGVPVVAAATGGVPEMISDGATGVLFAPRDVGRLTARLHDLLSDPARAEDLGAKGRSAAERYAPLRVAGETVELYRRILATNGH